MPSIRMPKPETEKVTPERPRGQGITPIPRMPASEYYEPHGLTRSSCGTSWKWSPAQQEKSAGDLACRKSRIFITQRP